LVGCPFVVEDSLTCNFITYIEKDLEGIGLTEESKSAF
jgi:hypothetical protein